MVDQLPVVSVIVSFSLDNGENFFAVVSWDRQKPEFRSVEEYVSSLGHRFAFNNKICKQLNSSIQQQLLRHIIQNPSLYNLNIDLKLKKSDDATSYFGLTKELLSQPFIFDPNHYEQIYVSENPENGKACSYCHTFLGNRKFCGFCNLPGELPYNDIINLYNNQCPLCSRVDGKFSYCATCCLRFHKDCVNESHLSFICPFCQMGCPFLKGKPSTPENILLYVLYRMTLFQEHAIFNVDIDEEIHEEYYKEMTYPIYLQQVAARLVAGQYKNVEELLMDVRQIYRNCRVYNSENSQIFVSSKRFQQIFELMVWQWLFKIRSLPPF